MTAAIGQPINPRGVPDELAGNVETFRRRRTARAVSRERVIELRGFPVRASSAGLPGRRDLVKGEALVLEVDLQTALAKQRMADDTEPLSVHVGST